MSPWIVVTVFMAVMALIFALLSPTAARADEFALNDGAVIEIADELDVASDQTLNDEEEPLPELIESDPVEVDETSNDVVIGDDLIEPTDEVGILDGLSDLISPLQLREPQNWGDLTVHTATQIFTEEGGSTTDPKEVGQAVWISGEWDGRDFDLQPGDSFEIHLPDVVTLRALGGFPLRAQNEPGTPEWGYCAPQGGGQNFFLCDIEELPGTSAYGEWAGEVIATSVSDEFNIIAADVGLGKGVEMAELDMDLVSEPFGTVFRWEAEISSPDTRVLTIDEPIVLEDSFSDNLRLCASADITRLEVVYRGNTYTDIATLVQTSDTSMTITVTPPAGGFVIGGGLNHTIDIKYSLCTASGGLDASGTLYENSVTWNSYTAIASETQRYASSGTIVALNRGTFDLNKVVVAPSAPLVGVAVPGTIGILVEEFAPGADLSGDPNASYTIAVDTDGTVINGENSRPDGWKIRLTEIPPQTIPGFTWGTPQFSGAGIEDSGLDAEGRAYAVFETTQSGNVGIELTNYLLKPEIGTLAEVQDVDNPKLLPITGGTVVDTISYTDLKADTEYRFDGVLMDVSVTPPVSTGIAASTTFTTPAGAAGEGYVSGTETVTFTITGAQAVEYAGKTLVVYERAFELEGPTPDVPVAVHEDPEDEDQRFRVEREPEIGTLAEVQDVDNPKLLPITGGTVVDTISYTDLKADTEYRFDGVLMDVSVTPPVSTGIAASTTFTTPAGAAGEGYVSGTETVTFTITGAQAVEYAGKTLVVYERAFELEGPTPDVPVAVHEDPEDEDQRFRVEREPEIGTLAEVQDVDNPKLLPITGGTVVDTISYTDLKADTEYRFDGVLMDVSVTPPVSTGIAASTTFTTPAGAAGEGYVSGTETVTFTITGAQAVEYAGKTLVVYERAFELEGPTPDVPVAVHEDPEDEDQRFRVEREPEIGTLAEVQDVDNPKLLPITGGTVVDTISYTDLKADTEYRFDGVLMDVSVTPPVSTGIAASTTFTTPAGAAGEGYVSGTETVTFTITGAQAVEYAGKTLVVYERAFELEGPTPDVPVAVHEDPEDEDQRFRVEREPEIGTLAEVQDVDNPKLLPITGGTVVDTISYTDLKADTEYRFDGVLMDVSVTPPVSTGIAASTTFTTPAGAAGEGYVSGTETVTFTITGAQAVEYAGKTLVVYERAFELEGPTPDVPVAVHEDPEDEDQRFDIEPGGIIVVTKTVTGPKGDAVENDEDAEFQIRAEWVDGQGNTQTRTFNVTPGQPVELVGLPLDTEIVLTEVGADTSVSNVKWGDIIWSGEGVVDQSGDSASGIITLENPGATVQVGLENKTSSNALIIIPIPIPLPPAGGGPTPPPAPVAPVTPPAPPEVAPVSPVSPKDGIQPSAKDGIQPQAAAPQRGAVPQAQQTGLAATGADVVLLAGGGIMILLLGAWLVLRGRRNES
ncbi:VaFE repeat-containing surface-anchored protein [Corynebacterium faecale]|uniref:VaFE repeat-containing surface-anchored protein n=1 Tax=Corynebacterium faecale TaxID=1758466 RepID=UPI0025B5E271|nr:VaFE repeat-containing surface-anchored protein [Corynebacterium faecale]